MRQSCIPEIHYCGSSIDSKSNASATFIYLFLMEEKRLIIYLVHVVFLHHVCQIKSAIKMPVQ